MEQVTRDDDGVHHRHRLAERVQGQPRAVVHAGRGGALPPGEVVVVDVRNEPDLHSLPPFSFSGSVAVLSMSLGRMVSATSEHMNSSWASAVMAAKRPRTFCPLGNSQDGFSFLTMP